MSDSSSCADRLFRHGSLSPTKKLHLIYHEDCQIGTIPGRSPETPFPDVGGLMDSPHVDKAESTFEVFQAHRCRRFQVRVCHSPELLSSNNLSF
jgi:hypothetical protein